MITICTACEKEYLIITETEEEGQQTIELVSTTIVGNVLDLSALPLTSVSVKLSIDNAILASTMTDAEGGFSFQDVPAKEDNTLLSFQYAGHSTTYNVISITEDLTQYTEVQMNESASDEFSVDENIIYTDDFISYSINPNQIDNLATSTIRSETSVIDSELIDNHFLIPVEGINDNDNTIHLDHHLAFQIQLFDANDKPVDIVDGGEFDLQLLSQIDFDKYDLWYFDERTALWEFIDSEVSVSTQTLTIRSTGLYSIASSNQPYLLSGIIKDASGEITPNAKITIRDKNGKIINETFTNSLGEYEIQLIEDLAGNMAISLDGIIVEEISFDDVSDPLLTKISLSPTSLTCKQLTIALAQDTCAAELRPMDIYEEDISGLETFSIEINSNNYVVWNPDELYKDIDWSSLINKTTDYTIIHLSQVGESPSCNNTITVIDNTPPVLICTDKITVKLDQMTAKIFAEDLDQGSFDNLCTTSASLTFAIARADRCDQECEENDFAQSITFTAEDVGKTVPVILKGTDIGGMSNVCQAEVLITE